jgi:hypothetical protein
LNCETEILRAVPGETPGTAGEDARAPRKLEKTAIGGFLPKAATGGPGAK